MKPKLVWDEWNIKHLKKHQVGREEIEQVYTSKTIKSQTYLNRILILGKTKKGRLLTIVISQGKQKEQYIIPARHYYEQTKTN